jgi:hypothetical protein
MKTYNFCYALLPYDDRLCGLVSEFLAANIEVPGSISYATTCPE